MNNKGFTIAEIIVAIAVISIISTVAVSIIISSREVERQNTEIIYAQTFCDNTITVFRDAAPLSEDLPSLYQNVSARLKTFLSIELPNLSGEDLIETQIHFDDKFVQSENGNIICTLAFTLNEKFGIKITVESGNKTLAKARFEVRP